MFDIERLNEKPIPDKFRFDGKLYHRVLMFSEWTWVESAKKNIDLNYVVIKYWVRCRQMWSYQVEECWSLNYCLELK